MLFRSTQGSGTLFHLHEAAETLHSSRISSMSLIVILIKDDLTLPRSREPSSAKWEVSTVPERVRADHSSAKP